MMRTQIAILLVVTAMTFLVTVGCSNRQMGFNAFTEDIQSPDPCVRIKAVIYAGNAKDRRAVPLLVDRLEDEDEAVRIATIDSLTHITGRDFGYRCFDPPYVRSKAVEQWRTWVKEEAKNPLPYGREKRRSQRPPLNDKEKHIYTRSLTVAAR